MMNFAKRYSLYLVWIISFFSVGGSLIFSEVLGYAPCVLCWYQRICMYPILLIVSLGVLYKDRTVYRYILGLSVIGMLISLFHNLLYWGVIPESASPCVAGVSCTTKFFEIFGFITIPSLSLLSFVLICGLMMLYKRSDEKRS